MKNIYLPILIYHSLADNEAKDKYVISIKSFEQQMQYLYQNGFKTITPEDISKLEKTNNSKWIMITFDDGYETDYTLALPILKKYGFRGVSFVTTGFLGKDGYMKWEQVQMLKEEGFSIQSHTHTHPLLKVTDERNIKQELSISKASIEERLKTKVISLSLPGGSYSEKVKNIALQQGYYYIFNSKPYINIINNGTIDILYRAVITRSVTLEKFKNIANLDKITYQQAKLRFFVKGIIKSCIGIKGYYRLWYKYSKQEGKKWH